MIFIFDIINMNRMNDKSGSRIFIILAISVSIIFNNGCTILKTARLERRKAKEFKDLPVELSATYTNEALATSFIKLRNNGTFHLEESAWGFSDHYYGDWAKNADTIFLKYSDNNHRSRCVESLILEKAKHRIKVNSDDADCLSDWYWKINYVSEEI